MAKLFRHLGLGCKKYQFQQRSDEDVQRKKSTEAQATIVQDYSDPTDFCHVQECTYDVPNNGQKWSHLPPETRLAKLRHSFSSESSIVRPVEEVDDYVVPFEAGSSYEISSPVADAGGMKAIGEPHEEEQQLEESDYNEVYEESPAKQQVWTSNASIVVFGDQRNLSHDAQVKDIRAHESDRDQAVDNEYDAPWEWCRILSPVDADDGQLQSRSAQDEPVTASDTEAATMQGRHERCIYETAFDCSVQTTARSDDDLEIGNHPILTGGGGGGSASSDLSSDCSSASSTPKLGDAPKWTQQPSKEMRHVVKALVHPLPPARSANSTPTLSYRAKEECPDSRASSAKSTPTHYMLTRIHQHKQQQKLQQQQQQARKPRVPLRPFGDLSQTNSSKHPPNMVSDFLGSHPSDGVVSSEESVTSSSSSSSGCCSGSGGASSSGGSTNNNRKRVIDRGRSAGVAVVDNDDPPVDTSLPPATCLQNECAATKATKMPAIADPRPEEDYDPSWEFLRKKEIAKSLMPLPRTPPLDSNVSSSDNSNVPIESPPNKLLLNLPNLNTSSTPSSGMRNNLSLNLISTGPKRVNLQMNFGCANLVSIGEPVNPAIPLERQGWYHGAISRVDAENLLRVLKEGSYLVRNSESSKLDYSLSLKSTRGFMHMKIVHSIGKYILGQFSKPFNNIPEMVHHYTINKLPIRGAEHMSLLHPVMEQLL